MAMTPPAARASALEREECISSTMVRGASTSTVRVTADPAGVLKDLEVDTLFDACV